MGLAASSCRMWYPVLVEIEHYIIPQTSAYSINRAYGLVSYTKHLKHLSCANNSTGGMTLHLQCKT